jgi:beta-1,2-xylosyltransferase
LRSFRGTPSGKGGHDEVARRIALNSQCWVERSEWFTWHQCGGSVVLMKITAWRREDMQVYMFLLYLEYARLASPDRDTGKMVSIDSTI